MKKDIRWLAGLLEGEGSFGCYRQSNGCGKPVVRITLCMTDEDVVRQAARLMGSNVCGPYRRPKRRPMWQTVACSQRARKLARRLLPYMGRRRSAKIKEALCRR